MPVNKIIYHGNTLIDLTNDDVTPETLKVGTKAHDSTGALITGTYLGGIQSKLSEYVGQINDDILTIDENHEILYSVIVDMDDNEDDELLDNNNNNIEGTVTLVGKKREYTDYDIEGLMNQLGEIQTSTASILRVVEESKKKG